MGCVAKPNDLPGGSRYLIVGLNGTIEYEYEYEYEKVRYRLTSIRLMTLLSERIETQICE